ncbi:DUF4123 domain-containing protein [Taibaiella koreensis]|uniref:DUF4123 domain-containing protein n=1 Tax=Taibaiella koreensis TaxID=1268548 RepID=UPI000E59F5D4|nr:DUF4123 domain-containing protein [Taibaiella koreensis]
MHYFCYDTAINKEYTLLLLQQSYLAHRCLFEGTKDNQLWDVAPWLFAIGDDIPGLYAHIQADPLASLERATIFESGLDLVSLATYLQEFIYYTEAGKEYFFRFWDAAVMDKYLVSCSPVQLDIIYGEALQAICCAPDAQHIRRYTFRSGKLHSTDLITDTKEIQPLPAAEIAPATETTARKPRKFFID